MIIGILSDTHGAVARTAAAIRLLRHHGAEAFVHCGDIGDPAVIEQFAGLRAWFVWGNMDDVNSAPDPYLKALKLPQPQPGPLHLELSGQTLVVFHGHEREFAKLTRLAETGRLDELQKTAKARYVLFGHTHRASNQLFGTVRFLNPGAVCRANPCTIATLDLQQDVARFLPLDQNR
jgi:putative phosphoesterase